jgi:hypothetical protein
MPYASNEPTLDDLLNDHIARLLMTRDGITEAALRQLLNRVGATTRPHAFEVARSAAPGPWRVDRREAACREHALMSLD